MVGKFALDRGQRLVQIGYQVRRVLDADGIPDQRLGDAGACPLRGRQLDMAGYRGWPRGRCNSAEVCRALSERHAVQYGAQLGKSAARHEREHAAEAAHLAACDGVSRMVGETWVI